MNLSNEFLFIRDKFKGYTYLNVRSFKYVYLAYNIKNHYIMSFGFIIPTCIRNDIHFNQLKRCIKSIRIFYETTKIILINDSENEYTIQIKVFFENDNNIIIKKTLIKGSADQQVFKVLSDTELFDKAIFVQDSMILNKKLENIDKINLKFIWHFTNHRVNWDLIKEPKTEYNTNNNIITHTDLIKHNVLRDYTDNKDLQKYIINKLKNKDEWCGCFGSLCIIDKKTLNNLNDNINFVNKFIKTTTNRDRRVNESIFSLICHYKYPDNNFENSYDELYYDGYKHGGLIHLINKPTGFDNLNWCTVHNYFSKISFDR